VFGRKEEVEKMLGGIFGGKTQKIKGTVVLMRKNVLDINSITNPASAVDTIFDIFGTAIDTVTAFDTSISIQLISSTVLDDSNSLTSLLSTNIFFNYLCYQYFIPTC